MPVNGRSHIRIARPSRDLAAAERFWVEGSAWVSCGAPRAAPNPASTTC